VKIFRFQKEEEIKYGVLDGDEVCELLGSPFGIYRKGPKLGPVSELRILAPCEPTKVVAVGVNYVLHAHELEWEVPKEPTLFFKPPSSVIGNLDGIVYLPITEQLDYEAELVVVIGSCCRDVPAGRAGEHILGYTCGNDVTARDLQKSDLQFTRSKGCDTFCPLGPWIETEMDPSGKHVRLWLDGSLRQDGTTADMIFSVEELISYASSFMTLEPGDVIMTGTPPGVGSMSVGSVVEIEVEGIGRLRNTVVPSASPAGQVEWRRSL
jgi:2-keto-4-pentenoate hydratase/2-oxohepta-3-ene-1,7-dioic acid hydratase in catechol pathway